ncbi:hypothetical protein [Streptomyces sp. NPDC050564]|uniref:hypothetical protein n=1 Tax=Streptomyces sp. NPDC050564 TaxID=3365631 RepID=UPI003796E8BB
MTVASRIALDEADRGSVERVRWTLADSGRVDVAAASTTELLSLIGGLQGALDILLRVIDGGAS